MTAFRFRMHRLLRVREIEEKAAYLRYAESARAVEDAQRAASALADQRSREQAELSGRLASSTISPRGVLAAQKLLDSLAESLWRMEERVKTLTYQAALLRTPWEELRRARRGLERLREMQAKEHALQCERQDACIMDEIASQRAAQLQAGMFGGDPASQNRSRDTKL